MAFKITLVCVYALLTATLITLKGLKVDSKGRGVVKMITSALFVFTAAYGCVKNGGRYGAVLAVGLALAALGDLFLVFMSTRAFFIAGVISFACASVTVSAYAVLFYGWQWWTFIPFAVMLTLNAVCQITKIYSFGREIVYLNVYTVCVSFCGSIGLVILCQATAAQTILFGLGCFMYMISDVLLGLYLLKFRHRAIDMLNTLLYFPGMFLIALSLLFV